MRRSARSIAAASSAPASWSKPSRCSRPCTSRMRASSCSVCLQVQAGVVGQLGKHACGSFTHQGTTGACGRLMTDTFAAWHCATNQPIILTKNFMVSVWCSARF